VTGEKMRKFIIHTERGGKTSIMEVEAELITAMEDPSVKWLPADEYRARITAPKFLYEKQDDGSLVTPIWHSWALAWTQDQAVAWATKMVRNDMQRALEKHDVAYTERDIENKIRQIEVIFLP
jgi:hypothetical protein